MYSLTQGGNLGQMISFVLVLIGMNQGDAEASSAAILVVAATASYVISWGLTWYGRWRKGDVTLAGFKE